MRPDSLPRLWRYINLLLTYLDRPPLTSHSQSKSTQSIRAVLPQITTASHHLTHSDHLCKSSDIQRLNHCCSAVHHLSTASIQSSVAVFNVTQLSPLNRSCAVVSNLLLLLPVSVCLSVCLSTTISQRQRPSCSVHTTLAKLSTAELCKVVTCCSNTHLTG